MRAKDVLGRWGEQQAAAHLEEQGLQVLDRNWRCREGELDLVARGGDLLVVCEVKTRSSVAYGSPAEAVDHRKLARLRRLALLWLAEHPTRCVAVRLDVVAVLRTREGVVVEHLPGVG